MEIIQKYFKNFHIMLVGVWDMQLREKHIGCENIMKQM